MAKYTTELKSICENYAGLKQSVGYGKVDDVISKARTKLFDFSYPIFDYSYKEKLETKIMLYFYDREIGYETVGLFKLGLKKKMNIIMPYYNQLYLSEKLEYDPLINSKSSTIHTGKNTNKSENNEKIADNGNTIYSGSSSARNDNTYSTNESATNLQLYSDTPQGGIANIENGSYLTNVTKTTNNGNTSGNSNTTTNNNDNYETNNTYNRERDYGTASEGSEQYSHTVEGISGASASVLLMEYRNTFMNIDNMIIDELESLFMQVW